MTNFTSLDQLPLNLRLARWVGHQSWISRGHWRLISALRGSDRSLQFDAPFFGKRYLGSLAQSLDAMVLFYGAYERHALAFLKAAAQAKRSTGEPVVYYDVGANLGHHVLFMSANADQVFAFEPYEPLQTQIREKIAVNDLRNVSLLPFGLGDRDLQLGYHPGSGSNSGAGTFLPATAGAETTSINLSVRIGDDLLDEIAAPPIGILKVDVEGFEVPVLKGLRRRIFNDRPIILLEFGDRTKQALKNEQEFRSLFYPDATIYMLEGRWNFSAYSLSPFQFDLEQECLVAIIPPKFSEAMRLHSGEAMEL